jgi:hypothetical protein
VELPAAEVGGRLSATNHRVAVQDAVLDTWPSTCLN